MKKFYINGISFFILFLLAVIGLDFLSMQENTRTLIARWTDSTAYLSENTVTDEIKDYIYSAQSQDGTTKLIIGDSVCRQMFIGLQEYNPDFTIIGSNGAITMAGQYLLAKEYLDNHPDATDVFLIVLPESFERTYDTTWGYQYAVMPFVATDTLKNLDQNTIDIIASTYGDFSLNPHFVNSMYSSGVNKKLYLNFLRKRSAGYKLSNDFELADQYVCKIGELCRERNVSFHLYPCPMSETRKDYIENLTASFMESKICALNPSFLDMAYYFPAEQAADGAHFSGDYANQECYNHIISTMFEGYELLDMLRLQ